MENTSLIARLRLASQRITGKRFNTPADVVAWMGMVQAQDFLASLWAIGLRMKSATERAIEQAIADRTIVRTWPARGTLHFVASSDVRWMLELLAPRAIAGTAGRFRQLGIDEATLGSSRRAIARALRDGKPLLRPAIFQVLESAHVSTAGQRGIHIIGRLAQEGLICYGPREGKQHTFVLLDTWIPAARSRTRDEALSELALRYVAGHGPATAQDFAWWSGLTVADARLAVELAGSKIAGEVIGDRTYWLRASLSSREVPSSTLQLLPAFDEFLVGYRDRSAVLEDRFAKRANAGGGILNPAIVFKDRVAGTWNRTLKRGTVVVSPSWFTRAEQSRSRALALAARRYGEFLELDSLVE